jgi:hypothetical protein
MNTNSYASNISAPIPEDVIIKKKVKIRYLIYIFITFADLLISLFTNIMNLIFFLNFKYDYLIYFIIFIILHVCFFIIFLFINSQFICCLLIFYGFLLYFYFIFEILYQIKIMKNLSDFMKKDYEKNKFDLIILTLIILSLIIRICILIVLFQYKNKLSNYEKFQRLVDHENFIERIENKVDKSGKSSVRWSDASKKTEVNDNKDSVNIQLSNISNN